MIKRIGVIGGAGYIGSFTVKALLDAGYAVDVIDNLSTGHLKAIDRRAKFFEIDIFTQQAKLANHFQAVTYDGIIHFAAKALVGESVTSPKDYYDTNVIGSMNLFNAAIAGGCSKVVFSSTCATYGVPVGALNETHPNRPINPYGNTKLVVEYFLSDIAASSTATTPFKAIALRYFNACGAEPSVHLGEDHNPESHLIPNVIKAGLGQSAPIKVFGTDYETSDGTAVRDYIHVHDLASAHLKALEHLSVTNNPFEVFNVGTGNGTSVKEIIQAVKAEIGKDVPHELCERRAGDPPALVASPSKIKEVLGWNATRSEISSVIKDAVAWHRMCPDGYRSKD